jgi:hypothetical protein
LYYRKANQLSGIQGKIKGIFGVYVVKTIENGITNLRIWAYTFENPLDITSIKFVNSVCFSQMFRIFAKKRKVMLRSWLIIF